ncbi:hypothetical protein I7I50_11054 [Histoplasma capsulatum G186AR]|uniref:Uncharacterized protein n=1 Tax=Ajellomyces capsulatus TaxID=5037 RepID=A0A8H8D7X0_AJECA|nr:hypothetical protein I7I52_02293 [Histoplasma capsulatum]QSS69680.1 hypothetical protein I7I50_11054 [Histoplasma capsulatum G186AR]
MSRSGRLTASQSPVTNDKRNRERQAKRWTCFRLELAAPLIVLLFFCLTWRRDTTAQSARYPHSSLCVSASTAFLLEGAARGGGGIPDLLCKPQPE